LSVLRQQLRSDAAATGLLTNQGKERIWICPRGWISRRLTAATNAVCQRRRLRRAAWLQSFKAIAGSATLRQRGSGLATRARDGLQLTTQSLFL